MEPVFKIANGDKQPYLIVSDGVFGLYEIKSSIGSTPNDLLGKFSKAVDARRTAEAYVEAEAVNDEIKKRRKAVKVGKEKWKARKELEALANG